MSVLSKQSATASNISCALCTGTTLTNGGGAMLTGPLTSVTSAPRSIA